MSESNRAQEMIDYLLGALPEAETERFDALSIADAEFAAELNASEKNLVDAYVEGELSGATLERFESQYLASPLRREKVEFARAFHRFAEENRDERLRDVAIAPIRPARPSAGLLSTLRSLSESLALRWSLAAVAATLLAVGGWWSFQNRSSTAGKQLVASFVLTAPVRGSDQVPVLAIAKGSADIEVQMELESDDYATYRVALADESAGAELWQSGTLKVTAAGENHRLAVRFPARLVKPGIYSLVATGIRPDGDGEVIGNYPFRARIE
jgi:hypothetical protein